MSNNSPLIIDFDQAIKAGKEGPARGTTQYLEPHLFFSAPSKFTFQFSQDVYSLGVVFYEILHRKIPFKMDALQMYENRLKKGTYAINKSTPCDLASVIIQCLSFDASTRITMDKIVELLKTATANPEGPVLSKKFDANINNQPGDEIAKMQEFCQSPMRI